MVNQIKCMRCSTQCTRSCPRSPRCRDGRSIKSDVFSIRRGVVQGDITSLLYFILTLNLTIQVWQRCVHVVNNYSYLIRLWRLCRRRCSCLWIAEINVEGIMKGEERTNSIVVGSKIDADMSEKVNGDKTKPIHITTHDTISLCHI